MANDFTGEKFASKEACKIRPFKYFANKDEGFYMSRILKLPLNGNKLSNKTAHIWNKLDNFNYVE